MFGGRASLLCAALDPALQDTLSAPATLPNGSPTVAYFIFDY